MVLPVLQKQLDAMADELQEMLTRSQFLGEQGDVDGAQAAAIQAEAIKVSTHSHSSPSPCRSISCIDLDNDRAECESMEMVAGTARCV